MVVTGFYRTCVIDGVKDHSPAEYVRRSRVPNESPTLGLSHLQFEALITAARDSVNRFDFALIAMLRLLRLRIFETWKSTPRTSARNAEKVAEGCQRSTPITLAPASYRDWREAVARSFDAFADRAGQHNRSHRFRDYRSEG